MLRHFIVILLLCHQGLLTNAEITDAEYITHAESLREHRQGMTDDQRLHLQNELETLYLKWKDPNNSDESEITSITGLLIDTIIPKSIPFTLDDVRYPFDTKSPGRNEFVCLGLRNLNGFAYLRVDDVHKQELEVLRALATTAEEKLKAQIRSHFFASADVSDISTEILQTYLALKSVDRPCVSSFSQVELIKMNWLNWCVDELNIDEKLGRLTEMDEKTLRESKGELVDALAFTQVAAGKIQLIESSLSNFNLKHSNILNESVNDMEVLRKVFEDFAQKYRSITWTHTVGTDAELYLGLINGAGAGASSEADLKNVEGIPDYVISLFHLLPTPENVPPEYLELATRYHGLVVNRFFVPKVESNEEIEWVLHDATPLKKIYEKAASAARLSESAGPTEDCSWAKDLLGDAEKLRLTYAKAADERYRFYAELLREYKYGITNDKVRHLW
ncbi:hypothetical protein SeMB42_g07624, partial [Synchytrium endobioticum]